MAPFARPSPILVKDQIQTGLRLYCLWIDETIVPGDTGSDRQSRLAIMLRVVPDIAYRRLELGLQYYVILKPSFRFHSNLFRVLYLESMQCDQIHLTVLGKFLWPS